MTSVSALLMRVAPAVVLMAAPASAAQWAVVPSQSSITFTSEWSGQTVEGRFPKFSANIRFDPARLGDARVDGMIDLSAATTNDRTVNGSLPGPDWLDVKRSSSARLQLTQFSQSKPGQYVARGTLSMRGVAVPVTLPFTLTIKGDTALMTGQTTLDRRSFKIGMESDASASWVAFQVPVKVRIVANRAK
jgi:polyisoprenoid-binding protein YceI